MPNTVTVRDPLHEMRSLMRRTFDDALPGWFDDLHRAGERPFRAQSVPLDVYETEDGLAVEALLPGFGKDDVDVTLEKGKLSIRAEKRETTEKSQDAEGRTYFLRERAVGASARSILIGDSYEPDSIEGSLKDGVLSIRVRKVAAAQPKRVTILEG
jgi:HSP20 family protein